MTLKDIEPGTRVIVRRLTGQGKIKRRLMDMGIIAGTEIEMQKIAPLGDPVEIKFKGYNLSLRREEAAMIEVDLSLSEDAQMGTHSEHRKRHRFRFGGLRNVSI
jgi:Fe2+ transport system protein FeoA